MNENTSTDGNVVTSDSPDPDQRSPKLGRLGPLLFQANFGWMLASGVAATLIPALMEQVDPDAKIALYGTLTSTGAIAGLVANVVFGSLSDRSRSRFGRRNPWILVGGLVAAASLSAMSLTNDFPILVALFVGFQIGLNALLAPLAAVLPDRVAPARRGLASAVIGFGVLLAQSLGSIIGAAFLDDVRTGLAIAPWIVAATSIVFVVFARDRSTRDLPRRVVTFREIVETFRIPLDRDFLLALFGRLMLLLAFFCAMLYQYFVLQDYIGLAPESVAATIALSGTVMAVASGIGTLISGPLSDRIRRRKPLVVAASLLIAVAFIPLIVAPSQAIFLTFVGVAGLAYGVYIAVDQALMSEVLPDDANHGKDMGILNIANTAPQFIAPGVAGLVLGAGLGYPGLFTVAALLAVLSAVLIGLIRRVR